MSDSENHTTDEGRRRTESDDKEMAEIFNKSKKIPRTPMTVVEISKDDKNKLREVMENFIKDQLERVIRIKSAQKIGQKTCVLEIEIFPEKMIIMKNKNKVKNLKGRKIHINNDLTKMRRETQEHIRKQAIKKRKNGRKVKIGYRKLIVNGQEWTWDDEEGRLMEVKNIAIRKTMKT
ncbi:hypothetical protein ILUMI_26077 [Ignelater luminosus]|uniref:Uncharacterized protein n=1 Tax=Ignelater luminosus TaxID=2038154 RepID=A0A8K0C7A1_IGNLU|nr:hypothetical protein ILUMI_26077 [Ignelater luminosus]